MYMAYTRLYNNIVDEGGCIWRHVVSNQIIWLGCTIIVAQVTQQQHNTCTWHNLVWVQAMQACRYCYTGWTTCRALRVQSSQEKVSVCQLKKIFFYLIWLNQNLLHNLPLISKHFVSYHEYLCCYHGDKMSSGPMLLQMWFGQLLSSRDDGTYSWCIAITGLKRCEVLNNYANCLKALETYHYLHTTDIHHKTKDSSLL